MLSSETDPVVAGRCRQLGIGFVHGSDDKLTALRDLGSERSLVPGQVAYVGNDINDLERLSWVGHSIAVADSMSDVLEASLLVTECPRRRVAVREVTDRILDSSRES